MTGWQWHHLDHMQVICTSLRTDDRANTSSLTDRMLFLMPYQQWQSTEGKWDWKQRCRRKEKDSNGVQLTGHSWCDKCCLSLSVDWWVVGKASVAACRHASATPARENDSQTAHRGSNKESRGVYFLLLLTYRTAERVSVKREWTSVCSHYSRRLLYRDDVLQCILGCGCELDVHGSKQMFSWQFLFNKFLICLRMGVSP